MSALPFLLRSQYGSLRLRGFLKSLSEDERRRQMHLEASKPLLERMRRLVSPAPASIEEMVLFDYLEWTLENMDRWVEQEASDQLTRILLEDMPFSLYLRAYVQEEITPDAQRAAQDWQRERTSGFSLQRSVEIANVGAVSEHLATFGLCNARDVNLLKKYKPVWLPNKHRNSWWTFVAALASKARLIILNATAVGTGFRHELKEIPSRFPEKTWLIAGKHPVTKDYISADIAHAVAQLSKYDEHVSFAAVARDSFDVRYAEPRFPGWVWDLVERLKRERSTA
jgi:hypothetical protein